MNIRSSDLESEPAESLPPSERTDSQAEPGSRLARAPLDPPEVRLPCFRRSEPREREEEMFRDSRGNDGPKGLLSDEQIGPGADAGKQANLSTSTATTPSALLHTDENDKIG